MAKHTLKNAATDDRRNRLNFVGRSRRWELTIWRGAFKLSHETTETSGGDKNKPRRLTGER